MSSVGRGVATVDPSVGVAGLLVGVLVVSIVAIIVLLSKFGVSSSGLVKAGVSIGVVLLIVVVSLLVAVTIGVGNVVGLGVSMLVAVATVVSLGVAAFGS